MDFVLIPLHLPLDLPGKQEVGGGVGEKLIQAVGMLDMLQMDKKKLIFSKVSALWKQQLFPV